MRELKRYRARRDPERTPEPFGERRGGRRAPGGAAVFVVQQHAARRMHWDLRLEIDDVLVSFAVPRGPSLDPAERRLAVRTEDHPLEYADFEGVIPAGNYGAGAMIVWDRGGYRTADGAPASRGLEAGKLDLLLDGHKLNGRFALVRTKRGEGRDWLLLRKGDAPAEGGDVVDALPASVLSGLTVEELRDGVTRADDVAEGARAAGAPEGRSEPASLRPMLAARDGEPFSREGWLFELKYDGVRVLAARDGDRVQLFSRSGGRRSATYPEIALAVGHLPVGHFVLDGEIVALDERGRASFERLQRRFTQTDPDVIAALVSEIPVVFYAFDLLFAEGRDLRGLPLETRKAILARMAPRLGFVRFADHVVGDGRALYEAVRAHGLEGIVAKRADSRYETGRRSRAWRKIKVPRESPLVIVGAIPGRGARAALGSLVLAWYDGERLVHAGNVGSGLDDASIAALREHLEAAGRRTPAFEGAPQPPARGTVYVEPELVCRVGYTEVTDSGLLRHPVFKGLQPELAPEDCRAPDARPVEAEVTAPVQRDAPLELTRLDKVFWPVEGYTKGDLLAYYEAAWPFLAPYLRDRPVVLTRHPDGIEGRSFYQKNAPDFTPEWARRERIEDTDYFVCNDLRTLLYVVNSGAIPLHVWSARLGRLDRPDWLILDLDPKHVSFGRVVELARHLHRLLDALGAAHFVKTSGQDGLHVMLPLAGQLDHDEARTLAEVLARVVCAERPDLATVARPLAARGDRVYVDFLQNGRGKLIAAPLSVRPRPHAPVSMPLTWAQVSSRLDPARWTLRTALRRIERCGDPLRGVLGEGVDVEALLSALGKRLERPSD